MKHWVNSLTLDLRQVIQAKEIEMKQHNKANWLWLGDTNTKKFSSKIRTRRAKNSILRMLNQEGNKVVPRAVLEKASNNCFVDLFGAPTLHWLCHRFGSWEKSHPKWTNGLCGFPQKWKFDILYSLWKWGKSLGLDGYSFFQEILAGIEIWDNVMFPMLFFREGDYSGQQITHLLSSSPKTPH